MKKINKKEQQEQVEILNSEIKDTEDRIDKYTVVLAKYDFIENCTREKECIDLFEKLWEKGEIEIDKCKNNKEDKYPNELWRISSKWVFGETYGDSLSEIENLKNRLKDCKCVERIALFYLDNLGENKKKIIIKNFLMRKNAFLDLRDRESLLYDKLKKLKPKEI